MENSITNNKSKRLRSPCVSNCCLDDEDICLGCFRHIDEITGWHSASDLQKIEIIEVAKKRASSKSN